MTFGEHVFLYCERGTNEALWAEPINAISNAGFFLAALIAWQLLLWRPREERSPDQFLLSVLRLCSSASAASPSISTPTGDVAGRRRADQLFMLVYLGFALNRFLGVPPGFTVLLVIGFAALIGLAMQVQCWEGGIGFAGADIADAKPCLNGSAAYLPALGASDRRRHAARRARTIGRRLMCVWAAVIFAVSIILRSLDMAFCDQVVIDGRKVGTHFIWHLLNAVTLFLLLLASFRAGPVAAAAAEPAPKSKHETPVSPMAAAPAPVKTAPVEAVPAKDEPKMSPMVASIREDAAVKEAVPEVKAAAPEPGPKDETPEAEPAEPAAEDDASPAKDVADEASGTGEADAPKDEPVTKKGKSKKKPSFPD